MRVVVAMLSLACAVSAQPLVDRYFDECYFPYNPTAATSAGIHKYDDKLEDFSARGVSARIAALKSFEGQFEKQPPGSDRDLILNSIRANLLDYEVIRNWERNPDLYSSGLTYSAFVIMSRTFAPPEARLRSLIARERQMPAVLMAARANLKNP